MVTFFIRMSGIINSITRPATWKTLTIKEEFKLVKDQIISDLSFGFIKNKKDKE